MRLIGCALFFLFVCIWDIARNWYSRSDVMILRRVLMIVSLLMIVGGGWLMCDYNIAYWVLAAAGFALLFITYAYCW